MHTLINYICDEQNQRHICLSYAAFVVDGIISRDNYDACKKRNKLQVIGRGGNGNQVWIIYSSLPERYKEAVLTYYRTLHKDQEWTPVKQLQNDIIKEHLVLRPEDEKALKDFRKADGELLPQGFIKKYATACKYLALLDTTTVAKAKEMGFSSMSEFTKAFIGQLVSEGVSLPKEYQALRRKLDRYREVRHLCVVNGRLGNSNSQKVNNEAEEWLIAQYSLPKIWTYMTLFFEYNKVAPAKGWKPIESEQTIYNILNTPENRQLWYGSREGWKKDKEAYGIQLKTLHPTFRDALWFADGTGWNFILPQTGGKGWSRQFKCYWVMDTFSETILGWHISESENNVAVYKAMRQSLKFSGTKPYELRYDNGSAHKMPEVKAFFDRATEHHFACQPYNGKSKPIENLTLRFQQQVMNKLWFFSGQNRTAHTERSQANLEFILENLKELPTLDEMRLLFAECVKEWHANNAPKHNKPRLELYRHSVNPVRNPIDELDMVNIFYMATKEPREYRTEGITLEIAGKKHLFEVYKEPVQGEVARQVDTEFRKNYLGEKLYRYYDHEDLSFIYLFKKDPAGMQFVGKAEPKQETHLAIIDHTPGEMATIKNIVKQRQEEHDERKTNIRELQEKTGFTPERMIKDTREKAQALSMAALYKENEQPNLSGLPGAIYGSDDTDEGRELED